MRELERECVCEPRTRKSERARALLPAHGEHALLRRPSSPIIRAFDDREDGWRGVMEGFGVAGEGQWDM